MNRIINAFSIFPYVRQTWINVYTLHIHTSAFNGVVRFLCPNPRPALRRTTTGNMIRTIR